MTADSASAGAIEMRFAVTGLTVRHHRQAERRFWRNL